MRVLARLVQTFAVLSLVVPPLVAQSPGDDLERRTLTIPMRDGVKLNAVLVAPRTHAAPLPIMLVRTPYGVGGNLRPGPLPVAYKELGEDGYLFVFQDIRGRYDSEGKFIMNGAMHDPRDRDGVDEATDTYDTVDWLVKHLPENNGRVGVMGVSYPGWLAGIAAVAGHPAIRAVSPQAPMTDTWLGDDFFHQGAFRQSFGLEYASSMELSKDGSVRPPMVRPRYDRYDWYLQWQTLKQLAADNGATNLPSWTGFRTHPAWDGYWQAKAMQRVWTRPEVPVLMVGGFWDQEDMFGPQEAYRVLEPNDRKGVNQIVLGPWFHGMWAGRATTAIGPIDFGSNTGEHFRAEIQRPWFAHWLHGTGDGKFPEAWVFESGENRWHTFASWPPAEARAAKLYLRENGALSFDAPTVRASATASVATNGAVRVTGAFDSYVSDPAHPVPYMPRPIDGTKWREWLVQDQRFVDGRPDVATWQTAPLASDVTIAGNVVAHLFASTTGTDADWVVKLIDVYPDSVAGDARMGGYELMVASDIMRGRYRTSWSKAEPIPANTVVPFTVDLHQQLYRFQTGHRIMVQVQSTLFPLYDRNPQTFVPNIFEATSDAFRAQTHRVWHTTTYPSHIAVGVLR